MMQLSEAEGSCNDAHLGEVAVVELEPVLGPAGAALSHDALRQLLGRVLGPLRLACAHGETGR